MNIKVAQEWLIGALLAIGTYVMVATLGLATAIGLDRLANIDPLWGLVIFVPLMSWCYASKLRWASLVLIAAVSALFLSVALSPVWNASIQTWPEPTATQIPSDVPVVVLSSNVYASGIRDSASTSRWIKALALNRQVFASKLANEQELDTDPLQSLRSSKVDSNVVRFPAGTSTRDEASNFRTAMPSATSIVLVTTPLHSRRAANTFRAQGFEVLVVQAPERNYDLERLATPTDRLRAFRDWVPELSASLLYKINLVLSR